MNKAWERNVLLRLDVGTVEFMDDKENFQKPESKEETKTEFIRWKVLTGRKRILKRLKTWAN